MVQIFAAILLLCAAAPRTHAQTERIRDFHSDIRLLDDGTLLVKETITVVSAGNQIRHGIYRDFPTRYKDLLGNNYVVGFVWNGAARDGQPESSRVENVSNGKRIYLGDKDSYVSLGEHLYELSYSTNRQLGFFKDRDELYWNVTGNGWGFPIDQVTATVTLPPAIANSGATLNGFTGLQGSHETSLTHTALPHGQFQFEATRQLRPREGLSIVLSFQKGFIAEPTPQEKLNYFLTDNRDALFAAAGLMLLLLYYFMVWSAVGRDPAPGVIMPLYEPPANLSPAAMRYLVRMGFDNKCFTAAILDMATRGFLKIKEQAGSYTIYRTKVDNRVLAPEEKGIAQSMLGERDQLWLHNENHKEVSAGITSLKKSLKAAEDKIYFFANGRYLIPGIVFSSLLTVWIVYTQAPVKVLVLLFLGLWLSIWTLGVSGLLIGASMAWKEAITTRSPSATVWGKAILFSIFAVPFVAAECFAIFAFAGLTSLSVVLLVIASVAVHVLFHYLLRAPTMAGRRLLDQVEGFKLFLGAVDEDRLNRAMPPNQTPETFEKFLPYALALDLEQAWSRKFAGVLKVASQAPGSDRSSYTPTFLDGESLSAFSGAAFASGFSNSLDSAISSSASAPGSDGGSGGSGGGGGGGGGGGW
jgi:uncharacterized membrane protein YgcG